MRILAFSDTHGLLPDLDVSRADCVMIAGDVCPLEDHSLAFQWQWLHYDFNPWVECLEKPVYLALGNHDYVDDFNPAPNLRYGTERVIDGILLFSWTPKFSGMAWEEYEGFLAKALKGLLARPPTPSIWLTHGPPWGVCDENPWAPGYKCGSRALRKAIEKYQPRLVICGHIHQGAAYGRLGNTEVYNVSVAPFTERNPVLIEI